MDQELIAYLDRRFAQNEETTRGIVEETTHRIVDQATQRLEGQIRQTQVMVEHLRSDLETVAEGVVDMNGKLDRHREENESTRREDRAFFTSLFRDSKGRLDDHGSRLDGCETRLTRLESARG